MHFILLLSFCLQCGKEIKFILTYPIEKECNSVAKDVFAAPLQKIPNLVAASTGQKGLKLKDWNRLLPKAGLPPANQSRWYGSV